MLSSDVVKRAKEKGFPKPDPSDNLSGMDVARKVTFLFKVQHSLSKFLNVYLNTVVVDVAT